MSVEDVFDRPGRLGRFFFTGRIERGTVRPGDAVEVVGLGRTAVGEVTALERPGGVLGEAGAGAAAGPGENVAVWLRGLRAEDVQRGQVVAAPGTVTQHAEFEAEAHILSEDQGGRADALAVEGKREARFYFRATVVTGRVHTLLKDGTDALMAVRLVERVPMAVGQRFAIRERGSAIGSGVVTKVLDEGKPVRRPPAAPRESPRPGGLPARGCA
ncbi:EF-Tu/IF-2/RF-3 family GTPase [Streptomyces syringium]|uniref:EF-Tu C-terminal domain-related protein n=1 Tax=Streptomyces syringium TaxID=76729 RepID=UPI0036535558